MAEALTDTHGYYAVIKRHYEEGKLYYFVDFPAVNSCYTEGATLGEAVELAEDVLGTVLGYMADNNIPLPAKAPAPGVNPGESVVYIETDLTQYRECA